MGWRYRLPSRSCWSLAAHAQEAKRELLAEHVSPSILTAPSASTNSVTSMDGSQTAMDGEEAARLMNQPRHKLTEGERWEKFEAEFGLSREESRR